MVPESCPAGAAAKKGGLAPPAFSTLQQSIVRDFDQHKGQVESAIQPEVVKACLEKNYAHFTQGQARVVNNILTSTNRFNIIQGDAGTGKTSALEAVKHIVDQSAGLTPEGKKIEITGLAFTGKASREIINQAGIDSKTLHSFLNSRSETSDSHKIWLVDESSMVGSRQMAHIVKRAIKEDAVVHFIGGGKQLQAIPAGRMFKDLQSHGHVDVIRMEEALRQKTDYMKAAVQHVKMYQEGKSKTGIDEAFKILEGRGRIKEISNPDEKIEAAANHYIEHPNRQDCLIMTPVNEDRVALNEIVHQALKGRDRPEKNFEIHSSVYMNGTDRYFARNYEAGQKAFIEKSDIAGLKPGKEVTISRVDVDNNCLTLDTGGKELTVDLKNSGVSFSVYKVEDRSFFEGEKVVFLKNDKTLDLSNGQTATIKSMGPEKVITARIDGQDRDARINVQYYPYLDRGYAVTVHKSQGQTAKEVLMVADSSHPLNKTETLYVAITRGENEFTLYANDSQALKTQFKEGQDKTSTMDIDRAKGYGFDFQSMSMAR